MDSLCRDGEADTRLLGRKTLGGKLQWEQKFRLEAGWIRACQQSTYLQLPNPPRHSPACVVILESFARQALELMRLCKAFTEGAGLPEAKGDFRTLPETAWSSHCSRDTVHQAFKPAADPRGDFRYLPQSAWAHIYKGFEDHPRPNFTIAIESLPRAAWEKIHHAFKGEDCDTSCVANTFGCLASNACEGSHQVKAGTADAGLVASHPMGGIGLGFMVLAEPDRQWQRALTAMPQGPACIVEHSLQRDGANDFRSLPGHAWAKIHAAFPAKSPEADLCMLPGAAVTETPNLPKVWTMNASDGRSGQSPLQGGPFLSGTGLGFVVLAVPSQHMRGIKLWASICLPPAPRHANNGDFRTLPSASWQKLYADFPGPSSTAAANGTGHTELGAAPTADDGMPLCFMALRKAVRKAVCCRRRLWST